MDELEGYARGALARHLVRLGFPAAENVPLARYLQAVGGAPLTSEVAFGYLLEWLRPS